MSDDPIQARINNGIYAPNTIPQSRRTLMETISSDSIDSAIFTFIILMAIPTLCVIFFIRISAGDYNLLMEYHNLQISQCNIQTANYTITPLLFNSTLIYKPAELHFPVTTNLISNNHDKHMENSSATFTFPTKMEVEFRCPAGSPRYNRGKCKYMVGDVLAKYQEFLKLGEFKCYVKDGLVVGTQFDYNTYLMPAYDNVIMCNLIIYAVVTCIVCMLTHLVYVTAPIRQIQNQEH